ncbi:MAG: hypothetical protein WC797_03145 [Candidatus Paceibacterota bacterium]|jgi:hypothetical protein
MTTRKIIIFVVIAASALGVYFFFYRGTPATSTTQTAENQKTIFPIFAETTTNSKTTPNNSSGVAGNTSTYSNTDNNGQELPKLRSLVKDVVAGYTFAEKKVPNSKALETHVRYLERGTGRIKEISVNDTIPYSVSNTTITGVFDATFNNTGDKLVIRKIDDDFSIKTLYAEMSAPLATSTENQVKELSLYPSNTNFKELIDSPNKNSVLYTIADSSGSIGITSSFEPKGLKNNKQVFSSPLKEWSIDWPSSQFLAFTTKPSYFVDGYLYLIDTKDSSQNLLLSGKKGLVTSVNPNTQTLIYSESTKNGFISRLLNIKTGESSIFQAQTIPDKCVWSKISPEIIYCAAPTGIPNANYPDDWYNGTISFSDDFWKINTKTGEAISLYSKKSGVDATNLSLDNNESFLALVNKNDSSLWILDVRP